MTTRDKLELAAYALLLWCLIAGALAAGLGLTYALLNLPWWVGERLRRRRQGRRKGMLA